jgi:diguanylate cyclase (GGDEF)-like protein
MENMNRLTNEELLSCLDLARVLTSELESDMLFDVILKKLSGMIPASNWSLLLLDHESGELYFKLTVDLELESIKNIRLKLGEGIAGQVALNQEPIIISDVTQSEHFNNAIDNFTGFTTRSIMCVPLIFGGRTLGVLEAVNPDRIDESALDLLVIIAKYTAIAVENMVKYDRISNLALKDDLTGLYNTRYLYQRLNKIMDQSNHTGAHFSLIFIDIDNFKKIVDTHGHLNGSLVIHEVAQAILSTLHDPAFGVSYGGDEFVVVLPGFNSQQVKLKAEEIRKTISQSVYLSKQGLDIRLTGSFGIATYPEDGKNITDLLGLADRAMFNVKHLGKNAVG